MPRKTKEQEELKNKNTGEKEIKKTSKVAKAKKEDKTSQNTKTAKSTKPKESTTAKKETAKSTKKTSTKKASSTSSSKKSSKVTTTKVSKSTTTKRKSSSTTKKSIAKKDKPEMVEYYDLPYRYNQTVVKVLAQTPTNLFIYWDISDADRKQFQEQYGENFFETTRPILIIYNDTLGYNFEVEINDFANSWYLHVNDAKCDYRVELGRRPIIKTEQLNTDYIYVSASNQIESPNNHILFNKNQKMVYFKNVKTGLQTEKPLTSISFIRNMGKIYDIYDIYNLYKSLYRDENIEEIYDLSNPSS